MLTRAQLLESASPREAVEIPALGGALFCRGLKAREIIGMYERFPQSGDMPMLLYDLVDESGARLLTDDDLPALMNMDFLTIVQALNVIRRLTGLLPEIPKVSAANS